MSSRANFISQVLLSGLMATSAWGQAPPRRPAQRQAASTPLEIGTALWRGTTVHYVMRNGRPVYQNDIILDHLVSGPGLSGVSPRTRDLVGETAPKPETLGVVYPGSLWPAVNGIYQIPYTITSGSTNLNTAIADYNTAFSGVIQWVPRTTQADYVAFDLTGTGGGGESYIGRIGGEQALTCGADCPVGTLAHEMGHATGLYHEQSRPDRDTYITLNYNHIQAAEIGNDAIATSNAWIYGPYDYSSVMEYHNFDFTADGSQTMQSIPAGIPLGNYNFYSSADIDTILRLYGAAPAAVTVDTNPTGLQVMVDGAMITTPHTYTGWELDSTHTLDIPAGISNSGLQVQAVSAGDLYYQFARWNDGGAANHSITITAGNGLPGYPATAPAQTVYTANFIQWTPFAPSPSGSYPSGAGTFITSPTATTFAGVGQFFVTEQDVAFTAAANPGYNFVQWYLSYACDLLCPASAFADPLNMDIYIANNIEPGFTTSQVNTIATQPSGLAVQVDSNEYLAPVRFSLDPNISGAAWATGTSHSISALSPQNPWSPDTTYVWSNWSDGRGQNHTITVPTGNSTATANFVTQVGLVLSTNSTCAGSLASEPPGPVNAGTSVSFTATPASGFVFAQWEGAMTGFTNPYVVPVNNEEFVQADFNTTSSPLTITSLSPASASAGATSFTLTINGTGFAPDTEAFVYSGDNYLNAPVTYVSPTQLQVSVSASDISTPGAIGLIVGNVAGNCAVWAYGQLAVSSAVPTLESQTITFNPLPNKAFGSAPFPITATASSGLTVSFASNTTAVCSVSGVTVTLLETGTCSITATQAGNSTYAAAAPITQTFTVTGATYSPGDFNGSGHADLMWLNDSTGQAAIWYLGGAGGNVFQSFGWLNSGDLPGWTLAGAADFNGDGHPDLMWQNNSTGQAAVWYMGGAQGNVFQSFGWLNSGDLPGWTLVGAADFNGDGHPDLMWLNQSTGQAAVWYMGGAGGNVYQSFGWLNSGSLPGWTLVGAADFNGDGHPDLMWQNNSTGQVAVWYMGGAGGNVFQSFGWLNSGNMSGWTVVGAVDLNADGHPDLIWQDNSTAQVAVWYMGGAQGNVYQSWAWIDSVGQVGWTAVARFN
jgi:Astacin (Peptidase family M12A)/FG-GAP-like repeat/Divergent InlB B-repeat domain